MGKSPGKWIKTILFGKKSSKSNLSKDAKIERKAVNKAPPGDSAVNSPVISDPHCQMIHSAGVETESAPSMAANPACDTAHSMPTNQEVDAQGTMELDSAADAETIMQEQAATKVQATFRSYLARRAFRALKGIIRLQALIRGHLVRRQAVATLRCMHAIVKFQALARGQRVRYSALGFRAEESKGENCGEDKSLRLIMIEENAFVSKLIASLPTAMPLSLQYDVVEPNSAWSWLERWSLSRFWEPLACPKKINDSKPPRKQLTTPIVDNEVARPKRSVRRVPAAATTDTNSLNSSDFEKPKRIPKKISSHNVESVQEHPQNELERVKRNLRKVSASASVAAASEKSGTETESLVQNQRETVLTTLTRDVSEPELVDCPEKMRDSTLITNNLAAAEAPLEPLAVGDKGDELLDDHGVIEQHSFENGGEIDVNPQVNGDFNSKDDESSKENQKTRRRRSFPAKQEYPENVSQNTPSLPSYMAATESAKAKLRAQGSPKLGEDRAENGFVRRHSLPSSTNGKLTSGSPRVAKPVLASGKGGSKSKSLLSSREEKVLQPGWRR